MQARSSLGLLRGILPNFAESVRFYPEKSFLVGGKFSLLQEPANRVQEVSVLDRVFLAPVNSHQVVPNVSPQAALVVVEHASRLRN